MANGMMSVIAYDGYAPTGPAAAFFTAEPISIAGSHEHTPGAQPAPEAPASAPSVFTMEAQAMEHDVEITMVDDRFEPTSLTIAAGTTVIWVNKGHDWHSVAAFDGSFESGRIGPGERFSTRLEQPGNYQYLCKHHGLQGMIGQLTVIPTDGGGRPRTRRVDEARGTNQDASHPPHAPGGANRCPRTGMIHCPSNSSDACAPAY